MKQIKNSGFTIIELLIATTVFSFILLLCTMGLILVGRMYQKGVIRSQTQEVARSIVVKLAESIQFSGGDVSGVATHGSDTTSKGFCVDNKRFSYRQDFKLVEGATGPQETNHALVADTINACAANSVQNLSSGSVSGDELLSPNMRVVEISVCRPVSPAECSDPPPFGSDLYKVTVKIAYGDSDLFDVSGNCIANRLGGSFCATSNLSTIVQKRIVN